MFKFVDESRESNPEPKILQHRKAYLNEKYPGGTEPRFEIDEFIIRFLAKSINGVSTFELSDFVREGDTSDRFNKFIIQREIWDLVDNNILIVGKDRRLNLAPHIKERLLNENLTSK